MPSFGKASLDRLEMCNHILQTLFHRVVVYRDCSITCGHRSHEEQAELYAQGRTKPGKRVTNAKPGQSKHNSYPSLAVDVVPWPEKWSSEDAFESLHDTVIAHWQEMQRNGETGGYALVWGGDWDGDGDREDQRFNDLPHYELVMK